MKDTDPRDVEYVAAAMAAAENGRDVWTELTEYTRDSYLAMADAAIRAMNIAGVLR